MTDERIPTVVLDEVEAALELIADEMNADNPTAFDAVDGGCSCFYCLKVGAVKESLARLRAAREMKCRWTCEIQNVWFCLSCGAYVKSEGRPVWCFTTATQS